MIFSVYDPDYLPNENNDIEIVQNNQWIVQSIYELQYFNCLGCVYKSQSKQDFVNHLYENHPEAILTLKNIKDESLSDIDNPLVDTKPKGTPNKLGRPLMPFSTAKPKTKKAKFNEAYKLTKDTAFKQNVPFNIILGNFGARYYHKIDHSLHELFKW